MAGRLAAFTVGTPWAGIAIALGDDIAIELFELDIDIGAEPADRLELGFGDPLATWARTTIATMAAVIATAMTAARPDVLALGRRGRPAPLLGMLDIRLSFGSRWPAGGRAPTIPAAGGERRRQAR